MARGEEELAKQNYCKCVQDVCKDSVNYWEMVGGLEEEDYDYN